MSTSFHFPAGRHEPAADPGGWPGYGLALCLAFLLVAYLYPIDFILGHGGYFQIGDTPQHVTGWLFYAQDGWRFPLLRTERISPPDGVSIVLTDSIPLAAVLLKPFASLLPDGFHYFGIWHVLLRVSQALAAVYLVRSLGMASPLVAVGAAAMALLWPADLSRIYHTALGTHAVLLVGLGLYFRSARFGWTSLRIGVTFGTLAVLTLLIHPYLAAMVLALFGAALLERAVARRIVTGPLLSLAGVAAVLGLVAVLFGYSGGHTDTTGLGHFSMNLLSPVCGDGLTVCPKFDATGGQYEGDAYLGIGTLVLLGLGLWCSRHDLPSLFRRHRMLVLVLVAMTIFAVSPIVAFGDRVLFTYSYPGSLREIAGMFRAMGRFFWPVGYAILFIALGLLFRVRRGWKMAVLAIAVILQFIETRGMLASIRTLAHQPEHNDFSQWRRLPGVASVEVYPKFGCGEADTGQYLYFQYVAATLKVPISTAYLARVDTACDASSKSPAALQSGALYVLLNPQGRERNTPPVFAAAIGTNDCAEFPEWNHILVCRKGARPQDWEAVGVGLRPL